MGAHHAETTELPRLTRVAGRGVLVASSALALTGAGAGAALATPDHGSDHESDHGWEHGWDDGHDSGWSDEACDTGSSEGSTDDLLGELGLASTPDELCDTSHPADEGWDDGHGDAHGGAPAPAPSGDTGVQPAAQSSSTNPEDVPGAPGTTRTIDLPDRPAGQA